MSEHNPLEKIDMTLSQAQDHLAHIVAQRLRWGKQYDASEIGIDRLTDALVLLAYAENGEAAELQKQLTSANRAAGAGKAREAKLSKRIDTLETEVANLNKVIEATSTQQDPHTDDPQPGSMRGAR